MSIAASEDPTDKQKKHINACRIYLQLIFPSDITSSDGRSITQLAYDKKRDNIASSLRWPNQQRPPKAWWNKWREFLLLLTDRNTIISQPLRHCMLNKECLRPWK
jgi:hypothetical protein